MIVRSVGLWFKNKQGKPHGLAGPMVTRAVASRLHFLGYVQAFPELWKHGSKDAWAPKTFPWNRRLQGFRPLRSLDGASDE